MKPNKLYPGLLVVTMVKYSNGEHRARIERYHYSDGDIEVKAYQIQSDGQWSLLACKYPEDLKWLKDDGYYVDGDIEIRIQFGRFDKLYLPTQGRCGNLLIQKRRQRRLNKRQRRNLHDPFTCEGCGQPIDPETCWCGIPIIEHVGIEGCSGTPMGCECVRFSTATAGSPKLFGNHTMK